MPNASAVRKTTVAGVPGHAGRIGVADELERIRATRVLGEALGVEVELAGGLVEVDVLEDRAEPAGGGEDVRLVHRREADRLGVAAALEVEQPFGPQPCSSSPMRQRSGSAESVVLPVPESPKKIAGSPSRPTFTDECIGRAHSSGRR